MIREAIAKRFGFLFCPNTEDPENKGPLQYLHVTGNMFLLVPKGTELANCEE